MRNTSYPPSSLTFDWIMAALGVLLMAGVIQDGWAHAHGLVDQSFVTPWHAIMYSCMLINGIVLGVMGVRNLLRGYTFRRGLPFGYWTSLIGVMSLATVRAAAAILIFIWQETTSWQRRSTSSKARRLLPGSPMSASWMPRSSMIFTGRCHVSRCVRCGNAMGWCWRAVRRNLPEKLCASARWATSATMTYAEVLPRLCPSCSL